VIAASNHYHIVAINPIDQAVRFINAARPEPRQIFLQGFRLADPLKRLAKAFLNQAVDPLQRFAILPLPILIILPSRQRLG